MDCKVITVFSSKGGVGKTLTAVNLATALVKSGKKVLLVDLDFQAGQDMSRMLNLTARQSIADILPLFDNPEGDKEDISQHTAIHNCGLNFIPVVKNSKQLPHITPDTVKPFFRVAKTQYDFILVDAGRSFSEVLISVLDFTNLILLVGTPDILSVYQIKWCLEVFQSLHYPLKMVKLILNRSESRGSFHWQEIRQAIPVEIFAHVPSDGKTVGMALNKGVPCVLDSPRSPVSEAFNKMVGALKKNDIYIETSNVEKERSTDGDGGSGSFWEKFGVTQQAAGSSTASTYVTEEDEVVALKRRIHEKLVERLNLDGISVDLMNDPDEAIQVKKSAEQVVLNLSNGGSRRKDFVSARASTYCTRHC